MIYYIGLEDVSRNTAGAKAPADIKELCRKRGYSLAKLTQPSGQNELVQKVARFQSASKLWNQLKKETKSGDAVIYQHPTFGWRNARPAVIEMQKRGVRFIALIHDIETIRGGIAGVVNANSSMLEAEAQLLPLFDAVICHNEKMRQYLLTIGFRENQLISLEIFDYLSEYQPVPTEKAEQPSVMIAGNLAKGKCSYIYNIKKDGHNSGLEVNLYGVNYEDSPESQGLTYHGSFKPEELPAHLKGDFGLVWDGTSAESCIGNTGEYLRYNNPHKTSLYLASGFPVIVWKEAAIADFVLQNGVGLAVDSLYELEKAIRNITPEEYAAMQKRVLEISNRLRSGYYFYTALDKALK